MGIMTRDTLRDVPVGISVTEVAGKGCMLARVVDQLLFRSAVTGHADLLLFADNADIQRLMRIVAAEAGLGNFVMSTA